MKTNTMKVNKTTINLGVMILILLTAATGAFAQKVKYNFAPGTDFGKYKTYKWVRIDGAQYPNQLIDDQVIRSIDSQLALKGLRKVDSGMPDLAVVYQVALNQEKEWNSYSTGGDMWGWGGWGGWGGYGGGMSSTHGSTSTITVGTLNLDMYDTGTKKQVWRGEATKTLDPPKDPNKLNKNIDKAMVKLLKNYPPPVKK
jgi:hypothetical protein